MNIVNRTNSEENTKTPESSFTHDVGSEQRLLGQDPLGGDTEGKVLLIKLEDIEITERERVYHESKVTELMLSIKDVGLINPITVYRNSHGIYSLVAGRHRLEAFRLLKEIDPKKYGFILSILTQKCDYKKIELAENLFRNDLTILEKGEHISKYLSRVDASVKQVFEELKGYTKQSRSTFFRLKNIAETIEVDLRSRIKNISNNLSNSTRQLEYLSKKCSKIERENIISKIEAEPNLSVFEAHTQLVGEDQLLDIRKDMVKLSSFEISSETHITIQALAEKHQLKIEVIIPKLLEIAIDKLGDDDINQAVIPI